MRPPLLIALALVAACGREEAPAAAHVAAAAEPVPVTVEGHGALEGPPAPSVAPSGPEEPPAEIRALLALPASTSASLRGPNDGAIEGAVPLPDEGPGFLYNPRRRPEARYGAVEVVQALVRAAGVVHRAMPGSALTINDLGFAQGGPISQHASHQAGRDVDLLFYLLDADGAPRPGVGAPLDPAGEGVDFQDLAVAEDDLPVRLDAPRTFRLIEALLEDPTVAVARIFVAEHLRSLLLAAGRASGAAPETLARFEALSCQPGSPHDDHLHIRFFCAPDDLAAGCEDTRPIYPWHREALAAEGLRPRVARPRPDRPRAKTTSAAEARAAAGPLHPAVSAWLERREAWLRPPRTGRPYCP